MCDWWTLNPRFCLEIVLRVCITQMEHFPRPTVYYNFSDSTKHTEGNICGWVCWRSNNVWRGWTAWKVGSRQYSCRPGRVSLFIIPCDLRYLLLSLSIQGVWRPRIDISIWPGLSDNRRYGGWRRNVHHRCSLLREHEPLHKSQCELQWAEVFKTMVFTFLDWYLKYLTRCLSFCSVIQTWRCFPAGSRISTSDCHISACLRWRVSLLVIQAYCL